MTEPPSPSAPAAPPSAPPSTALEHPRVPRTGMSTMAIVLAVIGTLGVGGYALVAYSDYEMLSPTRNEIPASVRSSSGGYRTYHFWHSGYHGGK